jgi:DNA polymerase III delta subunit
MSHLLYGQNPVALDERIAFLRNHLDPTGLSTTVIDVQSSSLPEIASACQAMPFFGGNRVVVLLHPIASKRGASSRDGDDDGDPPEDTAKVRWADLHDLLKAVPESTSIVMRHDGSLAATHYLTKAVKGLGWKMESFPLLRGQELLQWAGQRVAECGGSIDGQATVSLLNRLFPQAWDGDVRWASSTPDIRLLATEIDKLLTASTDGRITRELVENLVADREGYTAFRLNDAIFAGNSPGALKELSDMLDAGDHPERIMSQTAGEVAGIYAVGAVNEFGPKEVARVSGLSEGRVGTLSRKSGGLPALTQCRIAESIRTAGSALRSTESNAPAVVTPLVAEIAEAVRLSKLERGQRQVTRERGAPR